MLLALGRTLAGAIISLATLAGSGERGCSLEGPRPLLRGAQMRGAPVRMLYWAFAPEFSSCSGESVPSLASHSCPFPSCYILSVGPFSVSHSCASLLRVKA